MRNELSSVVDVTAQLSQLDKIELSNKFVSLFGLTSEISTENVYLRKKLNLYKKWWQR